MDVFNQALLMQEKQPQQALALCEKILLKKPKFLPAYNLAGLICLKTKLFEEGIRFMTKACSLAKDPKNLNLLASLFMKSHHFEEALTTLEESYQLDPTNPQTLTNLPLLYMDKKEFSKAIPLIEDYLNLHQENEHYLYRLARCYYEERNFIKASLICRKALQKYPNNILLLTILGSSFYRQRLYSQFAKINQILIQLDPQNPIHYSDLGIALLNQCLYTQAFKVTKKALEIDPLQQIAGSNLLFITNYLEDGHGSDVFALHKHWGDLTQQHYPQSFDFSHKNLSKEKKLKVGYVSSDIKQHSVAHFISPILQAHNRNEFDIYVYDTSDKNDGVSQQLKKIPLYWRPISANVTDQEMAQQIFHDDIDILIDLNGHTALNRLRVFALKPAPIQMTYLGYPNTTGLSTIDYRITDKKTDLPENQTLCSETLLYLPESFLCYNPPNFPYNYQPPPFITNGYITFGSFATLKKISPNVMDIWSEILKKIPTARLLLKNEAFTDPELKEQIIYHFQSRDIDSQRITMQAYKPKPYEHLMTYHEVDVSLDTFPYNGTTTTCESLWMGVPCITLCKTEHRNRVSQSILQTVGLAELVTYNETDYVKKAIELSLNPSMIETYKKTLNKKIENSYLCNSLAFTKNLEHLYKSSWIRFLSQQRYG